eukprot:gb/GECG01004482.1/.p1 GENE.gb/GECG01004482.1/~~gb/GECG01004482.1/.p1  ORF type:complete len:421 (+),score=47.75 gb/GECG01004482.1/:1-1263(+)
MAAESSSIVVIDGSYGEGGGQILRNAIALSSIAGVPVEVHSIRANRPKGGGLRPQHSSSISLLSEIGNACMEGNEVGSTRVRCYPKTSLLDLKGQSCDTSTSGNAAHGEGKEVFESKPGTAASTTLIAQASVPLLVLLPFTTRGKESYVLEAWGGTNQTMAPPFESLQNVLLPLLHNVLGLSIHSKLCKRGLVPSGNGKLQLTVRSTEKPSLSPAHWGFKLLQRGQVTRISAFLWQSYMNREDEWETAKRECQSCLETLKREAVGSTDKSAPEINVHETSAPPGGKEQALGITFVVETEYGCILSSDGMFEKPRKRLTKSQSQENVKKVVKDAMESLLLDLRLGICVDQHIQDQLVIFMALCGQTCQVLCGNVTMHTRSAMYVASNILGTRFEVKEAKEIIEDGGSELTHCNVIISNPPP